MGLIHDLSGEDAGEIGVGRVVRSKKSMPGVIMPGKSNSACERRAQNIRSTNLGDYAICSVSLDIHPTVKPAGY